MILFKNETGCHKSLYQLNYTLVSNRNTYKDSPYRKYSMARNTHFLGYTAALPLVAALSTTCIPGQSYDPPLDLENSVSHYVCPIDASSHNNLSEEGKTFSVSFDKNSWSLKGFTEIIGYARDLHPGMSVIVRGYAHTPQGLTEQYAQKRIESVSLFLQRGNAFLDFFPEIVYDAQGSAERKVEIIPQRSRVHEALDSMIEGYDTILIEQSMAMQKNGLWAALQAYDFAGKSVSLVTGFSPDCGKAFTDISALGRSVLLEGVGSYITHTDKDVLVISAGLSEELSDLVKKYPQVAILSPETLDGDGVADADTGRTRNYSRTY